MVGIPWIVFANAAASGIDLERRTQQKGATQQSTACRRSKHRNALSSRTALPGPPSTRHVSLQLDDYRVPPYVIAVSHTIKHKSKLLARVKRIKGQLDAVERALEAELGCTDVL